MSMGHFLYAKETIPLLCLLLCVSAVNLPKPSHDDPPYGLCSNNITYAPNSTFQKNLNSTMLSLSASASKIYNISTGNDFPDRVYGQYMCIDYVSDEACNICISKAVDDIKYLCPNDKEAVVWEEDCQLRYSYRNFLGRLDVSGDNDQQNPNNISDPEKFRSVVNETLTKISQKAAFDPSANMYATGKAPFRDGEQVYALVQCTPDLSPTDCNTCLLVSMANASSCCYFSRGARVLKPSCYLRYELYAFYDGEKESFASEQDQEKGKSGHSNLPWIFASALLVVIAIAFLYYYLTRRKVVKECKGRNEMKSEQVQLENISDRNNSNFQHHGLYPQESAIIDLASIQAATDKFSDLNMLGEGGFGRVYKGVLNDGKEIAVKRLSSFSEQGVGEFMNEVLLIMKLQHKNLVRLLGVCVDGGEKLLVYEFLPNGSLDVVLSDPEKRSSLTWRKRMAIINGIAKGLLYLHEDSRLRIIHCDLKPSNILLDSNMNPKISDFGMARIFETSEGEASTARIAGTYGYMAPEYAMEGLYSSKSDVFSFGVLLLEILTGKKNAGFHTTKIAPSLLAYAWQLWNEGNEVVLMDHLLADSCCPDEFSRYIHVGLLCVQEDAFDRPTMPSIVSMLKSETVGLPQPNLPAFSVGRFTDRDETIVDSRFMNGLTLSNFSPR